MKSLGDACAKDTIKDIFRNIPILWSGNCINLRLSKYSIHQDTIKTDVHSSSLIKCEPSNKILQKDDNIGSVAINGKVIEHLNYIVKKAPVVEPENLSTGTCRC